MPKAYDPWFGGFEQGRCGWCDWGNTNPSQVIVRLTQSACVDEQAARFVVNTLRVALDVPLNHLTPSTRLRELQPTVWSRIFHPPYYFLVTTLQRVLELVTKQHRSKMKWGAISLSDLALAVQQAGLPSAETSAPTIMKYGGRYDGYWGSHSDTLLLRIGHRDELDKKTLLTLMWGSSPPLDAKCLVCVLEGLEVLEQTPMGFFRPTDLLGMDYDDAQDALRFIYKFVSEQCSCGSGHSASAAHWRPTARPLSAAEQRLGFTYTARNLVDDVQAALLCD